MFNQYVKTQLVVGVAVLSVAVVLFGISLPTLFSSPCTEIVSSGRVCSIPAPSHEMELSLALLGVPFAIGGIGLIVIHRSEQPEVKKNA